MPFSPQRFTHRGACFCLGYGIEVAVDVGGRTHIAVSEPFLNLLHRYALGEQHRGAGVTQVVEAYLLQLMLLQEISEVSCYEVGIVEPSEYVHADVVCVFL